VSGIAPAPVVEPDFPGAAGRSVLLIGATGLVGGECLRLLLEDESCERIVVLTRRRLPASKAFARLETHVIDFDHLTAYSKYFKVDQIICALGTTRKQTPSRREYRAVDFMLPITAAYLGLENGASHFLLVSSLGADSSAWAFYRRLKGELEDALKALPYRGVTIVQPSVLIGNRAERRLSENVAGWLSFLTPRKFRPVRAWSVAWVLVDAARRNEAGVRVIENREISAMARADT